MMHIDDDDNDARTNDRHDMPDDPGEETYIDVRIGEGNDEEPDVL